MKSKLLITAIVAALAIMPALIVASDMSFAQSQRKTGSVLRDCYNDKGKLVPCNKMKDGQKDSGKKGNKN